MFAFALSNPKTEMEMRYVIASQQRSGASTLP